MKRLQFLLSFLLVAGLSHSGANGIPAPSAVIRQAFAAIASKYAQVRGIKKYESGYQEKVSIVSFDPARDMSALLQVIRPDLHLLADEGLFSSAQELLDYLVALNRQPFEGSIDKLNMKVLYGGNKLLGFIGYHRESKEKGNILVVAVDRAARAKGYGTMLVQDALKQLIKQGVQVVALDTGVDNITAQKCYTRIGFKQISQDGKHMHLAYVPGMNKNGVLS